MARRSGRPLAPRHLRRPPAAPCVAHHAHSHVRLASRVRTRPHPSRWARAPTHKRHTPAPCTNPAPFTCQAHTPHRRTRTTSSTQPRINPLQPTWPRRPPCTRSPLPPTSTQTLFCHSHCQPATSGPWHTHTRQPARVQHTTFTLITTQHSTPGHPTTSSPRPNHSPRTRT